MNSEETIEQVPNVAELEPEGPLQGRAYFLILKVARLFALLLDVFAIKFIAAILVWGFRDELMLLGDYAAIIGFSVLAIYFVVIPVVIPNAVTIGMAMVRLRIANARNEDPSKWKIVARYLLLVIALYSSGIAEWLMSIDGLMGLFSTVILAGMVMIIGNLYLLLFNWTSGQYLQDALLNLHVVRPEEYGKQHFNSIWKGHVVLIAISIISVVGFFSMSLQPGSMESSPELDAAEERIERTFSEHEKIKRIMVYSDLQPREKQSWVSDSLPVDPPHVNISIDLNQQLNLREIKPLIDEVVEMMLLEFHDNEKIEEIHISWSYQVPLIIFDLSTRSWIHTSIQEWDAYMETKNERGLDSLPLTDFNGIGSMMEEFFFPNIN